VPEGGLCCRKCTFTEKVAVQTNPKPDYNDNNIENEQEIAFMSAMNVIDINEVLYMLFIPLSRPLLCILCPKKTCHFIIRCKFNMLASKQATFGT